jgi:hypothetical protein
MREIMAAPNMAANRKKMVAVTIHITITVGNAATANLKMIKTSLPKGMSISVMVMPSPWACERVGRAENAESN